MQQKVTLLLLHCNKTCKTILTLAAIHDTLYRKSHHLCRKVQKGEDLFPMKIFTVPQHTRFILPPIHPTKFFACLAGRFFSFMGQELQTFQQTMTRRRPEAWSIETICFSTPDSKRLSKLPMAKIGKPLKNILSTMPRWWKTCCTNVSTWCPLKSNAGTPYNIITAMAIILPSFGSMSAEPKSFVLTTGAMLCRRA